MAPTGPQADEVLVVGAGAIGALYGGFLSRGGAKVSVLCRSEYDAVQQRGFDIRSPLGDFVFRPQRVLRSAAEVGAPPAYLILAVKTVRGLDRAALIRDALGPATVIVLIGNGIGIEAEIAAAFPDNELISVLAFVAASRSGEATIHHHALGSLAMGNFPHGVSPATRRLADHFIRGGVQCETKDDVMASRWLKNLWNIAFNPISVLGGVLDTRAILAPQEGIDFVRRVMQEAARVAAADGYPIEDKVIEEAITSTRAQAPYKTSMALDHAAGRAMEVEPILGNVVRLARSHGIDTPALESMYALMRMVEERDKPGG